MFVITADQRNSTKTSDLIDTTIRKMEKTLTTPLRPFQRTAGNKMQAVFERPEDLTATTLFLAREGKWSVGIGSGPVNTPLPQETRAGSGRAFELARTALEAAKKQPIKLAFHSDSRYQGLINSALQIIAGLEHDRTPGQQSAGELLEQGLTQSQIAHQLGITQQAVNQRLSGGYWRGGRSLLQQIHQLLEEE